MRKALALIIKAAVSGLLLYFALGRGRYRNRQGAPRPDRRRLGCAGTAGAGGPAGGRRGTLAADRDPLRLVPAGRRRHSASA